MNFESQLEEDKRIAFEKSYTFSVEVQEGKDLPWNEQENKIEDLKDAFSYWRAILMDGRYASPSIVMGLDFSIGNRGILEL